MDARIEKTLKKIDEAYLAEKRGKEREQVRVTDICARAGINKTTFYNHFCDVFALAERAERNLADQIASACRHVESIFSDPHTTFTELMNLSLAQTEKIDTLFEGRYTDFIVKLGESFAIRHGDKFSSDRERRIVLLCLVGSAFLLEKDFTKKNVNAAIDIICEIIEKTCKEQGEKE